MKLTHLNAEGRARLADVSGKPKTAREAAARGVVRLNPETLALVRQGGLKKGDVLAVARLAGLMAAKKTAEIIPLCHPLALTGADLGFSLGETSVTIEARVKCHGETGAEMEALTAVAAAALAIYDMCKGVQRDIVIGDIRLVSKTGGKSGDYKYEGD